MSSKRAFNKIVLSVAFLGLLLIFAIAWLTGGDRLPDHDIVVNRDNIVFIDLTVTIPDTNRISYLNYHIVKDYNYEKKKFMEIVYIGKNGDTLAWYRLNPSTKYEQLTLW